LIYPLQLTCNNENAIVANADLTGTRTNIGNRQHITWLGEGNGNYQ